MRALRFVWSLLRHKYFVLLAGRDTGVPTWRLLIHDWTKFTPAEFGPYVRRFGAGRAGASDHDADNPEWHAAWLHHWHRNPHHWEHWLRIVDGVAVPMEIPETYVREMAADWMGASRAYTGSWNCAAWYEVNGPRMVLHPVSRALAERLAHLDVPYE